MAKNKIILGAIPVLHSGYIRALGKHPEAEIWLLGDDAVSATSPDEPEIRRLGSENSAGLLRALGRTIHVLGESDAPPAGAEIIALRERATECFVSAKKINVSEWQSVCVRHDEASVFTEESAEATAPTNEIDHARMTRAAELANLDSRCFWRQVASVLVLADGTVIDGVNRMMPSEGECEDHGCIRDQLKPGEKPELCSAIHSEAGVIGEAAARGLSTRGASLYVTHFPCPNCAKLIAASGVSKVFFLRGWSNFDGETVMRGAGVSLAKITLEK